VINGSVECKKKGIENKDSQCKPALVLWLCKCSLLCIAFQDPYNSLPIFG